MQPDTIVLASASPRRRDLLAQLGIRFVVQTSNADESLLPGESPRQHAERLSRVKAETVGRLDKQTARWFIGSDTVVTCDSEVLGKPADSDDARSMLKKLSGRSHEVISGYAVYDRLNDRTSSGTVTTQVFFKQLTVEEIEGYIATGEPFDKAGAYAIQGIGAFMIPRIEGSYSNVVGMPICELLDTLEKLGAFRFFVPNS